jgi:metal-responsive CopG/Arc/MetJ family transcriptional regulator
MRITISLEENLLRQTKAVARADAISLSAAIAALLRKALRSDDAPVKTSARGIPSIPCQSTFSSDDVARLDDES